MESVFLETAERFDTDELYVKVEVELGADPLAGTKNGERRSLLTLVLKTLKSSSTVNTFGILARIQIILSETPFELLD